MSTNDERRAATRAALMAAGRELFVERGFDATATPDIVDRAGVTRGALYHHFADKRDLFRAIVEHEAEQVADLVRDTPDVRSGSAAYLDAMAVPGRTRVLLVDAPAVLGADAVARLDDEGAAGALLEGLNAERPGDDNEFVATLLAATFDRAATAIDGGADAARVRAAMLTIIDRVVGPGSEHAATNAVG